MTQKPKETKLDPDLAEQFEQFYAARRKQEAEEERAKTPPKDWNEFQDRVRGLIREENANFLRELLGEEGEGGADDTSRNRPPGEGEETGGFDWRVLLGGSGKSA